MRLHILSDLHFDARRKTWRAFADTIPDNLGDVMVVAGDGLCLADVEAPEMLARLREKAPEVIYILGNHEYFRGHLADTKEVARQMCQEVGVHLLDRSAVTLGGQRFLGTTLWFRHDEQALPLRRYMMDFRAIAGFEPGVYDENTAALSFLDEHAQPHDVVVTHHLPCWGSVAPMYRETQRGLLNPFFICDCEDIMRNRAPALWIHGHTHTPCDHWVGRTRVVCNPIGYPGEANTGRMDFTVDI